MIRSLISFLLDPGWTSRHKAAAVKWGGALVLLVARWWLASPFVSAGWHRINSWDGQEFLFTEVHPVPFVPAAIAAPMTTAAELSLGLLLLFGLAGRVGAAGLAVMAATLFLVIGRTPQGEENGIAIALEQIPWMIDGLFVLLMGPGLLSLDAVLKRLGLGARPVMSKS